MFSGLVKVGQRTEFVESLLPYFSDLRVTDTLALQPYDYLPNPRAEDDHFHPVKCLLGNSISDYLTHPYVSPLFGDFKDLPPLLIQAGDAEVLRDEITLLAHKASLAGVKVEHEIFEVSSFAMLSRNTHN